MNVAAESGLTTCRIRFSRSGNDNLFIHLEGLWKMGNDLPSVEDVKRQVESEPGIQTVTFDSQQVTGWDSGLLTFLLKVIDLCAQKNIHADKHGLPDGVRRLLARATAIPERKGARREAGREPFLARIGADAIHFYRAFLEILTFLGEVFVAFTRLLRGKARFRASDLFLIIQECSNSHAQSPRHFYKMS